MVDKELITAAHAAGVEVNTWTVNDLERAVELAELGVDGLITDLPDRVLEVLDR
jgi:glycerophosphoryl diester phosphodiesterase